MLHLRVICPAGRTDRVLDVLADESAVTNVSVLRGAAVEPAGDLIEADVSRAVADELIAALRTLDLVELGAITLDATGTVLSAAAARAERAAPGRADESVVWEQIRNQVHRASELTPTFFAFLTIAFLLSAVGVTTASPLTLVGAMVVGPEFQPLAALSVGMVRRDRQLVRRSLGTLALSFPAAMLVTGAATLLWIRLGWIGVGDVENARNFDFIYEVGPFSLVVALLAGAAGMLALVTSTSAVLVGVFISVTTVPAAGLAVVAAIAGKWHVAGSSIAQLAINLTGIVLAGVAVLLLRPRATRRG
ncbi:DUF389 domain-containing protein [Nocardia sp. NPDC058058]|uniref:DUF389 domain-containing protein n=1 Tax=Nocardia sp. NPDC058058 TaxID=3346317 RepID=UPI0036DCCBDD